MQKVNKIITRKSYIVVGIKEQEEKQFFLKSLSVVDKIDIKFISLKSELLGFYKKPIKELPLMMLVNEAFFDKSESSLYETLAHLNNIAGVQFKVFGIVNNSDRNHMPKPNEKVLLLPDEVPKLIEQLENLLNT